MLLLTEFLESEMPEFILPLLWSPNLPDWNPVDCSMWSILQEKMHKNMHHRSPRRQTTSNIASEPITPSLLRLNVSGVVFQLVSGWAVIISSTAFNSNIVSSWHCSLWSLHWLVESNSCRLIFRSDFLAVVSYNTVRFNTTRFNSQGKVAPLFTCGNIHCISLVSHYLNDIPCKNYNYTFVFSKLCLKHYWFHFFQTQCTWLAIYD